MDGITEAHSEQDGSSVAETVETSITYAELKAHVAERRSRELEELHPDRRTNQNARANTTRALDVFMQCNGLVGSDVVGPELLGTSAWDRACRRLGNDTTAKRRRSEMQSHVRRYAIEFVRARDAQLDDESFGERLSRLRQHAGLSVRGLAKAASTSTHKTDPTLLRLWEAGQRLPAPASRPTVLAIARALGVDPQSLLQKLPNTPHQAKSFDTGLPRSRQRRVAKHLPDSFDTLKLAKRDEILLWVGANIISTPKEVLDDGSISRAIPHDCSIFALGRNPNSRLELCPAKFLDELDAIAAFKTSDFQPTGKRRNKTWDKVSQEHADYNIRSFFGALRQDGFPLEAVSMSAILAPEVINRFISWRYRRRGGYTRTIVRVLEIFDSLLHPDFGFIAQTPYFGRPLQEIDGFINKEDVERVQNWSEACCFAREHIQERIKAVTVKMQQGRDPFEALLPVVNAENPRDVYYKIIPEIRARMPDGTSDVRRAEALRALMLIRLGLVMPLRQKNMRQMLLCPPGQKPRRFKDLARLGRGELVFTENQGWIVRITREAFKNRESEALERELELPIPDIDGLYDEIAAYIQARETLLNGAPDPGTFFVKTMQSRAEDAEYGMVGFYNAYRAMIETYGIYNPYTGRGAIVDLKPHGPHAFRHVMATSLVKKTGGYSAAAAFLLDTEETVRKAYARFRPTENFGRAQYEIWGDMMPKAPRDE